MVVMIFLLFTLKDKEVIFQGDPLLSKKQGNDKEYYKNSKWEKYGYIDLVEFETYINENYSKTLDYGASVYVFKCGPDGEDVLYWSKYYGVFPTNTGASALSWNLSDSIGDAPKLNIKFKYSFKRDMSPISLFEFNRK